MPISRNGTVLIIFSFTQTTILREIIRFAEEGSTLRTAITSTYVDIAMESVILPSLRYELMKKGPTIVQKRTDRFASSVKKKDVCVRTYGRIVVARTCPRRRQAHASGTPSDATRKDRKIGFHQEACSHVEKGTRTSSTSKKNYGTPLTAVNSSSMYI